MSDNYVTVKVDDVGVSSIDSSFERPEDVFFWLGVGQQLVLGKSFSLREAPEAQE